MKKFIAAVLMCQLASPAAAQTEQNPVTTTTQVPVVGAIATPISIVHLSGLALNFGFVTGNGTGTIELDQTNGGNPYRSAGDYDPVPGSPHSFDGFRVEHDSNRMHRFRPNPSSIPNTTPGVIGVIGIAPRTIGSSTSSPTVTSYSVGGRATISNSPPPGVYLGTYTAMAYYE